MGLLFENGDIEILEPVLEEKSECRLETEVYLPDYLPDIQKLLRWEIIPRVQSRDMLAGRITIEGEAEIRIFYKGMDEDKIRCISVLKEFSHTVAVSEPNSVYDISTKTTASINSARASGARKITIKAEVITCIVAAENKNLQLVEKISEEIEGRVEKITAISKTESTEREIRITEELRLPESTPPISSLLYTDATVKVVDISVGKGRIVIKGELTVKPVYVSASGSGLECAKFNFPVSQIIDISGVDDSYICDGDLQIVSVYAEPDFNSEGNSKTIDCEIVINSVIHAYKLSEYSLVTDVFSPKNELSVSFENIKHLTCYDFYRDVKNIRGQLECDSEISGIIDISASSKILRVNRVESCMNIEGVITAEVIYRSEEGIICSKKGDIDFGFSFPYACTYDIRCDAESTVLEMSYTISGGNTIDIRSEIAIKAAVCAEKNIKAVRDITITGEKDECKNCPITLYFAEKKESVWEIAKQYNGSVSEIMNENSLETDCIPESRMLIIPLKQ